MNNYILLLLLLLLLSSCHGGNMQDAESQEVREVSLDSLLTKYVDSISFLDKNCLRQFEESFIKYEVWGQDAELLEGGVIFPKRKFRKGLKIEKDELYLGFLYKNNEGEFLEVYLNKNDFGNFYPIHLLKNEMEKDSVFLVKLFFNDTIINCNDWFIKGSNYSSRNKNGIFIKQIE